VNQGLGTIDVVPVGMANIKGPQFLFSRDVAHAVDSEQSPSLFANSSLSNSAGLHRTSLYPTRHNGQGLWQFLDVVPFAFDLRCVVQVKDIVQLAIDREDDFVMCEWLPQQRLAVLGSKCGRP